MKLGKVRMTIPTNVTTSDGTIVSLDVGEFYGFYNDKGCCILYDEKEFFTWSAKNGQFVVVKELSFDKKDFGSQISLRDFLGQDISRIELK